MKQAVMTAPYEIVFKEVEAPVAKVGEVVIRTKHIGICGSDLHVFKGEHPLVSYPLVQGHEFSGVIEQVGGMVDDLGPGDLVTVQPAVGCGRCERCREGQFAQCDKLLFIGGALEGAGSELFRVRADHVVKMKPGTDSEDVAMVEPLSVAVHAVRMAVSVAHQNVLVVGGGTIGNLTAQVARIFGAAKVIIVEMNEYRRAIAEKVGISTLDPREKSFDKDMRTAFAGAPIDASFECVGHEIPLGLCVKSTRRGGSVIVLGVYDRSPEVSMIDVQDKELHVVGSLMYTWTDYGIAVSLVEKRALKLSVLRSHHFPFERWPDAYRVLTESSTKAMKVMIDLQ